MKSSPAKDKGKTLVRAFCNILALPEDQTNVDFDASITTTTDGANGPLPDPSANISWGTSEARVPLVAAEYCGMLIRICSSDNNTDDVNDDSSSVLKVEQPQTYFVYDDGVQGILQAHSPQAAAACSETLQTVNIDSNCEWFIKLLRAQADLQGTEYRATGEAGIAIQRLATLKQLTDAGLSPDVFRNVLRQAELDMGTTAMKLAEHPSVVKKAATTTTVKGSPTTTAAAPPPTTGGEIGTQQQYYAQAVAAFTAFGAGFRREMAIARREMGNKHAAVLECTDLPSYVVGEMRRAEAILKTKDYTLAATVLRELKTLVSTQPDANVQGSPGMVQQLMMADEMLGLLESRQATAAVGQAR